MRADINLTGRQCRNGEQIRQGKRGVEHMNIKCGIKAEVLRSFKEHLFSN